MGVALIVVAAALLADELWRPDIVWPLALIGIGLLLFRYQSQTEPSDAPDAGMPAQTSASEPAAPSPRPQQTSGAELSPRAEPAGAAPPPTRPRRPRSVLGRATVAVGLVASGVAALLDTAGLLDLGFEHYLALALTIVGAGLLVGSWWGRSAMLLVLGALLTPALLATSLVDVPLRGGAGEPTFRPSAWQELRPEYELGAGELTLDLSGLDLGEAATQLEASVGMGELTVIVPADVPLRVEGRVGAGSINLFDAEREGLGVELVREIGAGPPRLRLLLEVGMGEITVRSTSR